MPPTLLQRRDLARKQRRQRLYEETRRQLRESLAELVPGDRVILFGSLTKPGLRGVNYFCRSTTTIPAGEGLAKGVPLATTAALGNCRWLVTSRCVSPVLSSFLIQEK